MAKRSASAPLTGEVHIKGVILVNASPEKCYGLWRDFRNLPKFLSHLVSVTVKNDRESHWVVSAPADTTAEWDAEIIEDRPGELISWRSLPGAQIDNAGSVTFSPAAGGKTHLKVTMTYNPPFGVVGEAISRLFGESREEELADDLARFKHTAEKQG